MTILYVHGVRVRSEKHGIALERPFRRWLGPKLSVHGQPIDYVPVYWGNLAARFRWNLASRPKTDLLHQGGDTDFAGLGALREASADTPLDVTYSAVTAPGPVLGTPAAAAGPIVPPLTSIPRERRADFLADLYLVCRKTAGNKDAIVDDPDLAALADAAETATGKWSQVMAEEDTEEARAQRLVREVQIALDGAGLIGMGGLADWMTGAGESLKRAAAWPGDVVGTVFAETRPILNEFVAYFVGDVFTYLSNRGDAGTPGAIPLRLLGELHRAHDRKKRIGERIVIVSHSMGGQLVYDALTYFADHDAALQDIEVDHWITCGSQVSLFAEMRLFLGQPEAPPPVKLPMPSRVKAWTNYFDRNDMAGFWMTPVFEGVQDREYNTGYGLALAHTGFLARPSFFKTIAELL